MKQKPLDNDSIDRIETKIAAIEQLTQVEVVVVVTNSAWMGIKAIARRLFKKHIAGQPGEDRTIMILLDLKNRELLVSGGEGIDNMVPDGFWQEQTNLMVNTLKNNPLEVALGMSLQLLGQKLLEICPAADENGEAADEISNQLIFDL